MSGAVAVLAMAYGTPASGQELEPYYTHLRGGRPPSGELLEELRARYEAIGGRSPLLEISLDQCRLLEAELRKAGQPAAQVVLGMKHATSFHRGRRRLSPQFWVDRVVGLVLAPHYSRMSVRSQGWHSHPPAGAVAHRWRARNAAVAISNCMMAITQHDPLRELRLSVGEWAAAEVGLRTLRLAPVVAARAAAARRANQSEARAYLAAELANVTSDLQTRPSPRQVIGEWVLANWEHVAHEVAHARILAKRQGTSSALAAGSERGPVHTRQLYGPQLDDKDRQRIARRADELTAWFEAEEPSMEVITARFGGTPPSIALEDRINDWFTADSNFVLYRLAWKTALEREEIPLQELASLASELSRQQIAEDSRRPHPQAEMVPIEAIAHLRDWDRRPGGREAADPDYWRELKDHIAQHGFEHPIILRYNPRTGRGKICEGNHRLAIAEALGLTHVPLLIDRASFDDDNMQRMHPPGTFLMKDEHGFSSFPNPARPSMIGLPTT